MKKIFMMFAMAQMIIWSCAKPELETPSIDNLNTEEVVFSATVEATKVTPAAGGAVSWTMDDEIGVYDGTDYVKATVLSVEGNKISFSAKVNASAASYIAVSPYEAALTDGGSFTISEGKVKIATTAAQTAGKQVISIATTSASTEPFAFKNVANLLRFKVNKAAVKKAKITGAAGTEKIAGTVSVDPATGAASGELSATEIVVDVTPGVDNFIALAPGTSLPDGFTITFYGDEISDAGYEGEVASAGAISFTGENARNKMLNLGLVDGWIDNYKLWLAGKPITIAGVEYTKASTGLEGTLMSSPDGTTDLRTNLHSKTTDVLLFLDPGEYVVTSTPNIGTSSAESDIILIGRYDNDKPTIKGPASGNSWFSMLGGSMVCKNIHFDMTDAANAVFRTYTHRKISKVHADNCRFTGLYSTNKVLLAVNNTQIHGVESIRVVNSDMSSTFGGLCSLVYASAYNFLDEILEVVFENNIIYNTNSAGYLCIFHTPGDTPSSSQRQNTDFVVKNNTFYNFPAGTTNSNWATYIKSNSLKSLTITDNIFYTEATPTAANIMVYSKDTTNEYPYTIDRNVSNVPTFYYFNPNQGIYNGLKTKLSPTNETIFSVADVKNGIFTPVAAYASYGAQR